MLNMILLLVLGSALTYISKYNLEPVNVNMGVYTISNIPLFYVIVGSLIMGLIMSYLMQMLSNIFTYFEIRRKSREIQINKDEIMNLTKTVHKLELDNEKLKHTGPIESDPNAL